MVFRRALAGLAVALLAAYLYERAPVLYMMYSNAPQRIARLANLGGGSEIKFADRPGFRSCEDALLVESLGVALVACDPGRERWNTVMGVNVPDPSLGPVPGASLYVYDYKTFPGGDGDGHDEEAVLRTVEIVGFPRSEGEDGDDDGERDLHTLGMAFDEATATLLVANHARFGGGSRIEVFKLDGIAADGTQTQTPKATHVRTVRHPLIHAPNSIALVEGAGGAAFFVTNDHAVPAARNKLLSLLETYVAPPTGTVVYVDMRGEAEGEGEVKAQVVARVPFANGIEVLNETTLAVASTSRAAVYLYEVSPPFSASASSPPPFDSDSSRSPYKLTYTSRIRVPFLPDNLSLTRYYSSGTGTGDKTGTATTKLLIAGHAHVPSLARFSATRHACNGDGAAGADAETRAYCERSAQGAAGAAGIVGPEAPPSWVSEWSEEDGLRHLYVDTEYPSSATAARDGDRGVGIIAGLYAKGLLVWREQ
ncbi:hypothetical protein SLS62_000557 [Diatrype stigma]|uniref:Serum paraoxonase/arylesterase 2 n=1 Tax=Diatrype stigma TaxID=117547 RepID=A0AAN9V1W3_9PEZI